VAIVKCAHIFVLYYARMNVYVYIWLFIAT